MSPEEKKALEEIIRTALETGSNKGGESGYTLVLYLVPIFGIVFGSTLLWFLFFWWHRQKIALIKAGLYKSFPFDIRAYSFFIGLLLTFTGLVLSIVFIMVLGRSMAMLGGLIPLAIGLSLLTFYKLRK
ncbi:MAG: hypothetical protein H7A25_25240 [Leptospiraceae bacterium]|nr:hypothetical protein [Leptospiraceae bacterium]MCP5503227.1 hypothetical protein [Leptospiraceae bacterium]